MIFKWKRSEIDFFAWIRKNWKSIEKWMNVVVFFWFSVIKEVKWLVSYKEIIDNATYYEKSTN